MVVRWDTAWVVLVEPFDDAAKMGSMILADSI
jgi:hypothetical protein